MTLNLLRSIVGAALLLAFGGHVLAQDAYPSRPIQIVVGFTPGGGSDTIARILATNLSTELKVPVTVDNKPGAGGVIATDFVAKSKPDGHTLLVASPGALTIIGSLRKLPYDPLKDIQPITQLTSYPNILVANAEVGVSNVAEMVRKAKGQPGKLDFASTGSGTTTHLAFTYLNMLAGMDLNHIPYKGNPPAMADVLAGRIAFMIGDPPPLIPHIATGRLKALAVTTRNRSKVFPNIPSMAESGVSGYDVPFWHALTAPRGTPPEVVARLEALTAQILGRKEIAAQVEAAGMEVFLRSAALLTKAIEDETARWANVIKVNKIQE